MGDGLKYLTATLVGFSVLWFSAIGIQTLHQAPEKREIIDVNGDGRLDVKEYRLNGSEIVYYDAGDGYCYSRSEIANNIWRELADNRDKGVDEAMKKYSPLEKKAGNN